MLCCCSEVPAFWSIARHGNTYNRGLPVSGMDSWDQGSCWPQNSINATKKTQTLEGFLPQGSYSFKARSKKDLRYLKNDTGTLNYLKAPLLVHRVERFSGRSQPKPPKPPKPHTLVLLPNTKHHLPAMHTLPPVSWERLASQSAFNTHRQISFHHPGQLC